MSGGRGAAAGESSAGRAGGASPAACPGATMSFALEETLESDWVAVRPHVFDEREKHKFVFIVAWNEIDQSTETRPGGFPLLWTQLYTSIRLVPGNNPPIKGTSLRMLPRAFCHLVPVLL